MSTQTKCQRDGRPVPSLDIYAQYNPATGRKLTPQQVAGQCLAAKHAAQRGYPPNVRWCHLAIVVHEDYRASRETLRLNGWRRRAA